MEMIRFGAFAGLPKQLLQASAKIWESAGFKVAPFDDLQQMVWDKPPENSGRMKYPFYINTLFRIFGLTPEGLGGRGLHQKLRRAPQPLDGLVVREVDRAPALEISHLWRWAGDARPGS
jgi:hypothetical protein